MFKLHGCSQMQVLKCRLVAAFLWLALFATAWNVAQGGN